MNDNNKGQLLLTPGPLTTSEKVKTAMLKDWGSRDDDFIEMTKNVCRQLHRISGLSKEYTVIPLQGSGTFAVEAMIGTIVPEDGKLLILINGSYGERMVRICEIAKKNYSFLSWPEDQAIDPEILDRYLEKDSTISHVAAVLVETTTGLLNPFEEISRVVAKHNRSLLLDAMSGFGAVPVNDNFKILSAVAASSNKCIESVPGLGFVIARKKHIEKSSGNSHSLSLDLYAQYQGFQNNGQWRFTPPTQVVAALNEALKDKELEAGINDRRKRYQENCELLRVGMRELGFSPYLPEELQAPVIVTFLIPTSFRFVFSEFYTKLKEAGFTIYPGKLTKRDSFRVGCIGQVHKKDIEKFLVTVRSIIRNSDIS